MKQVEKNMIEAIAKVRKNGRPYKIGSNTAVYPGFYINGAWGVDIYLYDSLIASYSAADNSLHITNDGYNTNTTKSRLNAILEAFGVRSYIVMRNFEHKIVDESGEIKPFYKTTFNGVRFQA